MTPSAAGFFIHYRGAWKDSTGFWNAEPTGIVGHEERLWDWKDLQFLR